MKKFIISAAAVVLAMAAMSCTKYVRVEVSEYRRTQMELAELKAYYYATENLIDRVGTTKIDTLPEYADYAYCQMAVGELLNNQKENNNE